MTTEERLATLEREQTETKTKLEQLEKALEGQRQEAAQVREGAVEVRARKFVVVDKNGNLRAILALAKTGPMLGLGDENGKLRTALGLSKDGAKLSLRDENGKTRARLSVDQGGQPGLRLLDEKDKIIWSAP
jgi:hypothetical protein